MENFERHQRKVIEYSLNKPPEEMLSLSLELLISISGARGGSILAEEGANLKFLFADKESLIGVSVPWDSIAGSAVRDGRVIYTFAPKDERHFRGVDDQLSASTNYLLTLPIPAVQSDRGDTNTSHRNAGALQLLFDVDIFPELNVEEGPQEFTLDALKQHDAYAASLQEVTWILPNISLGMEVMKLRQTSYQCIHELKNKLIAAQSWVNCLHDDLQMLAPEALEDPDVQEDVALATSSIREGSALAVSYLQFTKIYTPEFCDTALNDVLANTAASLRAFVGDQGRDDCIVTTNLADDLPRRQLDPDQLKMAFFNLGKNAAEVLIEHKTEHPEIRIDSRVDSGRLIVTVTDNGPGMPQEIAENLFVAFKTKKQGGTGLGLTITKKIVEVHDGTIHCDTDSNGTRFTVTL